MKKKIKRVKWPKEKCQKCGSDQVLSLSAKCSDLCDVTFPSGKSHDGYVPELPNIGSGDYVKIRVCLKCGQLQGKWPIEEPDMDQGRD